ncbi:zinc finger protein, partial [Clarias magur]
MRTATKKRIQTALISKLMADPTYPESSDTLTADEDLFVDEDSARATQEVLLLCRVCL